MNKNFESLKKSSSIQNLKDSLIQNLKNSNFESLNESLRWFEKSLNDFHRKPRRLQTAVVGILP